MFSLREISNGEIKQAPPIVLGEAAAVVAGSSLALEIRREEDAAAGAPVVSIFRIVFTNKVTLLICLARIYGNE